jgi:hypothetical protein
MKSRVVGMRSRGRGAATMAAHRHHMPERAKRRRSDPAETGQGYGTFLLSSSINWPDNIAPSDLFIFLSWPLW